MEAKLQILLLSICLKIICWFEKATILISETRVFLEDRYQVFEYLIKIRD